MSSPTTNYNSGILKTNFDYSKQFIWNPRTKTASYTNSTGSTVTLNKGMLIGRIFSSNKVAPQVSTATDGSQAPIGVLMNDYVVANGSTVTVTYLVAGDVAREALILSGSDTLATVISLPDSAVTPNTTKIGTIEDILNRSGIITIASQENTAYDN